MRIHNESLWDICNEFVLDSCYRFGDQPATKFVYQPDDRVLILGSGLQNPNHKSLISSYVTKFRTDTSLWVRGIVLRKKKLIYYRQGVMDPGWYDLTTEMLRAYGLPGDYQAVWGPEAKRDLKDDLADFP